MKIEFKSKGGIYIKPKNRGSFRRWCGGNVTEECIRRGKASSNPKIRKKATFADNARRWKHKEGGKTFIKGVNVLDSNSNAYKYVKKKYKMHQQGGNLVINYIKAIENPNRVGWNGKVWQAPNLKGYDINQRGYGIDINTNQSAKKLTNGRPGRWITDAEATKLMNDHISYITNAANKHIKGFNKLSLQRQAALLGMLYRGDSVNKSGINYLVGDDKKFFTSIGNYYRSKGLNERANNSDKFFKRYLQQGGNINWGSTLANIGSNILQTYLQSSAKDKFGKEYDEATNKQAEAMKSKSWGQKYEEGLKLAPKYFEQNSQNGINYSAIDYQQFAKNYADSNLDLDAIENFKLEREQQKKQQIDAIQGTSPLGNILQQGLGIVGDYFNNKSSKTPNISFNKKTDFGNIKTDFGQLGTYSVNSGYQPKQLSFDWSKVGNIK